MELDEFFKNLVFYIPVISFVFGVMGIMIKLALKRNNDNIKDIVSHAKNDICNKIFGVESKVESQSDILERHERWFEQFFSNYISGYKDVRYRDSVRNYKKGDSNEPS